MKLDSRPPSTAINSSSFDFLDPLEIINEMIDLRAQLAELEQQVKALQPAFYAAVASHTFRRSSQAECRANLELRSQAG